MMRQKVIPQPFRPNLQEILAEGVMGTCDGDHQTWHSQGKYRGITKIQLAMSLDFLQDHVVVDSTCSD